MQDRRVRDWGERPSSAVQPAPQPTDHSQR
jgi:hypothetical protein